MPWRVIKALVLLALVTGTLTGCRGDEPKSVTVAPAAPVTSAPESVRGGEALFKQFCAACHPNGGNVSDPKRTLYGTVLKSNHITTPEDIVRIMRHPLSRMIRFDVATLPDRDARTIAEYVLKTFR